jgi:hypothetical protein
MSLPPDAPPQGRPLWQKLVLLLAVVLALAVVYNALNGRLTPRGLSETLFWAALLLAIAAVVPIAGDPGGALLARRAIMEGGNLEEMAKANRAARHENRGWIALFGLAAAIVFALSFVLSSLG